MFLHLGFITIRLGFKMILFLLISIGSILYFISNLQVEKSVIIKEKIADVLGVDINDIEGMPKRDSRGLHYENSRLDGYLVTVKGVRYFCDVEGDVKMTMEKDLIFRQCRDIQDINDRNREHFKNVNEQRVKQAKIDNEQATLERAKQRELAKEKEAQEKAQIERRVKELKLQMKTEFDKCENTELYKAPWQRSACVRQLTRELEERAKKEIFGN